MIATKGIAREPSTALGFGFIAVALDEFQHGITMMACLKFLVGIAGVLLRENALPQSSGTRSTSVEVSASVKKEESNGDKRTN